MAINARMRVDAVFAGRVPDRVPVCHVGFSSKISSDLLGREAFVGGGIQKWREVKALWEGADSHREYLERSYRDAMDLGLRCGNDILRPVYWRHPVKPTRKIDEDTYAFERGPEQEWQVLRYDAPTEQCVLEYARPRPEMDLDELDAAVEKDERAVTDYRPCPEDFAFQLRALKEYGKDYVIRADGIEVGIPHDSVWMEALALRSDLVARHLDHQTRRAIQNVEFLTDQGFRYLFGGYDFASQTGPMFSPRIFAELVVPRLKEISDACHRRGARHLFASDGNLWPVAGALFGESGIDGYYEIDRRAGMDLDRLRNELPHLTLVGNISSQTIHTQHREAIVAEVMDCLQTARTRGRIVIGVSNYIVPGTPDSNLRTLLETIEKLNNIPLPKGEV